jgi:plasmid stabilization system protein ParE
MSYKLIVTERAKEDRDRAFDWYSENYSKEFAARWYEGISEAVVSLARNPMRGHLARESDRFPFELYELLVGKRMNKHRILYTVEGVVVQILRIRHSAQRDLGDEDL